MNTKTPTKPTKSKSKICGIYKIVNVINGNVYLGQSVNIKDRWHDHKRLLRKGTHDNPHLQNAWIKYGETNFKFEFLDLLDITGLTTETIKIRLKNMEDYQILQYETANITLYNIEAPSFSTLGQKRREEQKAKIPRGPNHKYSKIILQYDLLGNFIKEWRGLNYTAREIGINSSLIRQCCSGKLKAAGNYIWRNKEGDSVEECIPSYPFSYQVRKYKAIKPKPPEPKREIKLYYVLQYDLLGNFIKEWELRDISYKIAFDRDKKYFTVRDIIREVALGRRITAYGSVWKFKVNNIIPETITINHYTPKISEETKGKISQALQGKHGKPILQYTLEGKFIREWPTGGEINRILGFNSIYGCCNGRSRKSNGYRWAYKINNETPLQLPPMAPGKTKPYNSYNLLQYNLYGEFVGKTKQRATTELKNHLKGKQKTHQNYIWKLDTGEPYSFKIEGVKTRPPYVPKGLLQFTPNWKFVKYWNRIIDAEIIYGPIMIGENVSVITSRGYLWRREREYLNSLN